ncbi:RNA methyltransferase [Moheibacter lacus]|uniref:RNA methyltransferase n=1 Tax=Moheibacter lacus TaxID=2745851 RepID=A0A838ZSE1_9FLAO|nr:RNA methyltransferase [Moheibacter lacus]MBA5629569.1 RNA methyltransferase [Moheibacter lacus]
MRKLKLEELGRISVEEFKETDKIPVVVIMDNVRSAHNIGSVFRTADAFLIEKVFLCGISPTPPNKEIRKTALGATESVDWEQVDEIGELIERLKGDGYKILSIEQAEGSTNLSDLELDVKEKCAVVFGNEVDGVQQSVINQSDICVEIPQGGTKHSLNVSVCAGVLLWEFYKKFEIS